MCSSKNGQTTDYYVLPGETVTYNWNADNVVSCSIDDRDQDIPWPSCFPGPRENYTANVPLSGSCQMTAPEMGNNPTLKVACRDRMSKRNFMLFQMIAGSTLKGKSIVLMILRRLILRLNT